MQKCTLVQLALDQQSFGNILAKAYYIIVSLHFV